MSKFENLMDDMKSSAILLNTNKILMLPEIIGTLITSIIVVVVLFIAIFAAIGGSIAMVIADINILAILPLIIVIALITSIILIALSLVIEVGVINMIKEKLNGDTRGFVLFGEGLKKYYFRALGTSLAFICILIVVYTLLLIPVILYLFTVGILSGGWAMVLLTAFVQALIGYWLIIMVNDDDGGFASIGKNLKFGKTHMTLMVLIFFLQYMLATNLGSNFGLMSFLINFIFVGVINTYFKSIVILTYRRYKL